MERERERERGGGADYRHLIEKYSTCGCSMAFECGERIPAAAGEGCMGRG